MVLSVRLLYHDYYLHNYNNTLSQRTTTIVRSNDTLGNTPFQLISDVSIRVLSIATKCANKGMQLMAHYLTSSHKDPFMSANLALFQAN